MSGETSALTIGAASELVRNDGFAFLYAKPGLMPPLSPVFRRNTRLGLHHWPGSFVNCSDQPRRDFNSRGFFRICRVPRVRRVIRVIRVIRVRIERPEDLLSPPGGTFVRIILYSISHSTGCHRHSGNPARLR